MQPDITAKSWAMILTLGFVWGASFIFNEVALAELGPIWIAAFRVTLAAALTHAVWMVFPKPLFPTSDRPGNASIFAVSIMSTTLPFALISWGQQTVTAGFAGISMAAVALIVLPLAHFFLPGERLTLRRVLGFAIGFVGVVVLIGPENLRSTGASGELWGRLACVGGAACYAISTVVMRRMPSFDPIAFSAVTLWIGAGFGIIVALISEGIPPVPSLTVIAVVATLGLFQTAAANFLRITVVRTAGPVFMSLTNYQVPLWSVLMGVVFLSEAVTPSLFLAMALILIGVFLSQWGALKRLFGR